jgi:hypothetical protein
MKTMRILLLISIFIFSAQALLAGDQTTPPDTLKFEAGKNDEGTEYELLIMDPGFDRWFIRVSRPISFYEQTYLENWNRQLAQQWNVKLGTLRRIDCAPQTYLDYDPKIDYGKELNYKLFYYFRYMHEKCRIFDQRPGEWR